MQDVAFSFAFLDEMRLWTVQTDQGGWNVIGLGPYDVFHIPQITHFPLYYSFSYDLSIARELTNFFNISGFQFSNEVAEFWCY